MPSNETDNYLRLHLLNNEGVSVLRATFLKIVESTCNDVDQFLKEFKQDKTFKKLSSAQRKILFPENGPTNVNEWDVSLLCFILRNCCTLEGKICLGQLQNLVKKQSSAHNDIDDFLVYNKSTIDQMLGENVINQEQYHKLFPQNSSQSKCMEWDLKLLLSMLNKVCSGQNKTKLDELLQNCVKRDIRLHVQNVSLTEYLKLKEPSCIALLEDKKITIQQYFELFPKDGEFSDINNWDKQLLEVFVTNVCGCLEEATVSSLNVVNQIRNKMLAHKGSPEMKNEDFSKTWADLANAINVIIKSEVPTMTHEWTQKQNELYSGPFDLAGTVSTLKDYYFKETSEVSSIKDVIGKLDAKIGIENRKRKADNKATQRDILKLRKTNEGIDVRIVAKNENQEVNENTERKVRFALQNLIRGNRSEIRIQTVERLVDGITNGGTEIEDIQYGSIVLKVKCYSLKGISNLLIYLESQELRHNLQDITDEIKLDLEESVELGCTITDESKENIMSDLDRITIEYERMKPLVCYDTEPNIDAILKQVQCVQENWQSQHIFNEAFNKVCQERDQVVEAMRHKEREMETQIQRYQENLEQMKEEKVKAEGIKDRALNLLKDKEREFRDMSEKLRHLKSKIDMKQQQVIQYKETIQDISTSSDIEESVSAMSSLSPSILNISDGEEIDLQQKIRELEKEVKHKIKGLSNMQQKVMDLSMSARTRLLAQDKVSITSCHVGDLVLLCLDERLDQYVVFTVGSTLHFLHTDCLQPLGLKTSAGEAKKQWQIAEVTDKEYCQAKKANNRFKVPVGSKFYRIKAKKWSRETTSSPTDKTSASTSS